jgi:parallel beta-helix repeat protein
MLVALAVGLAVGLVRTAQVRTAQKVLTVCPQGCHYAKIQEAINAAVEGDTIQVKAGTYTENLRITKGLTLQGESKDKVTIVGTVTILSTRLVTLGGFTVKGGQGVQIEDSTTIVLSDNAFVESTAEGLLARSSFTVTLRGNLISRNKSHGLLLALGSRAIITGNTITSNGGDGVTIRASQADLSDNIVRDNGGCGVRADADSTVTGSVTSANTSGNQAGNLCEKAVKLDTEPPTITAKLEPRPTAQGWNNSDVRVTFECVDTLSGIASCSEPKTLTQEGKDQPVTGEAVDKASNRASTTVKVSIDKTKPAIQAGSPRGTLGSEGWYRSDVTIPFTATDNLSGLDPDGRLSVSFEGTTSGEGTDRYVDGRIKDRAGNEADPARLGPFKVDKTAPTVTAELSPRPNTQGWNNGDVTVSFRCEDRVSGVARCSDPVRVTQEGRQEIRGTGEDRAGNIGSATANVNLDKTAPIGNLTINNGAATTSYTLVTLRVSASDALSGVFEMRFSNDGGAWSPWEGYSLTRSNWDLTAYGGNKQQGPKTVYAQARDRAGNESPAFTATITLVPSDKPLPAPQNLRVTPSDWTNVNSFTIDWDDPGQIPPRVAAWYKIGAVPVRPDDGTRTTEKPFKVAVPAEGEQPLYVWLEDEAGRKDHKNRSSVNLRYDKTPPTGSLTINDEAATTLSTTVTLRLTAADSLSGLAEMRFSNDGQTWSEWESFSSMRSNWDLFQFGGLVRQGGPKTVYAQLRDRAGNVSQIFNTSIRFAVNTLYGHTSSVKSVAFSPHGKLLASAESRVIKLWDVATGQEVRTLSGHSWDVNSVAFSPDGWLLASGSDDRTIKLWDVATGQEVRTLTGHEGSVKSVAFSPDGRLLASGSCGLDIFCIQGEIKLWEITTGPWKIATAREVRTFKGHASKVTSVGFSSDGQFLFSSSCSQLSSFGNCIQGEAMLWEIATGKVLPLGSWQLPDQVLSEAFSPGRRLRAYGFADGTIELWKEAIGQPDQLIHTLEGHTAPVTLVAFSPDGRLLASASADGTINLWDIGDLGGR